MSHARVESHDFLSWPQALRDLFLETYKEWSEAAVERMGAALAYYALLSLAPLLIIVISLVSIIWDAEAVRGELVQYLEGFMGVQAAQAIRAMIQNSTLKGGGILPSVLGFLTLAWGATSVVAELQASMDTLWKVKQPSGFWALLKQRSSAFILIVVSGFLFLISMLMSAALAAFTTFFENRLPIAAGLLRSADSVLSLLLNIALCAVLFKSIPKVSLQWKDVIPGAAFTAILLTAGKAGIGLYLGEVGLASVFGAAGSIVIVMVWVYYSAQLFFFGAEFARVYANRFGSRPHPE